jgi:hypothetical protein
MSDAARRILLTILFLGISGISLELWLMAHTEDVYQLIPLFLALAGVFAMLVVAARPSAGSVRLFQMVPALSGMALYRKAIVAKSPPALAPGAMIQLGLIGLAYTFRHPALVQGRTS